MENTVAEIAPKAKFLSKFTPKQKLVAAGVAVAAVGAALVFAFKRTDEADFEEVLAAAGDVAVNSYE